MGGPSIRGVVLSSSVYGVPMLPTEPVADGAPVPGWAPVVADPALEALLRPGAIMYRLATGATWSEGPVWLPQDGSVLWSDVVNDRVLRWYPEGRVSVVLEPAEFQNGHTLDHDGSIIACSHGNRRVERLALDGTVTPIVERYRGKRLNSPNDVIVKSDGTIWFSDPPYGIASDLEGHQAESEVGDCLVFRFDPRTGELEAVTDWVEEPNGLAFSPDESVLYVADTSAALRTDGGGNHQIAAFDVVDGRTLANPRVFYTMDEGLADGFRVDVDGNVWTSAEDGIHVLSPDGRRLGRLPIPERTSNCVFGGPDGDRLFITASTSLYMLDVATRGAVPPGRR
jgi:gluconolactonase